MRKIQFFNFFHENMLENILGFDRMHENKIFFCFFFCLLKRKINLKVLRFFLNFLKIIFRNISEKAKYFNTRFVSYSVKIEPNIKQKW